VGGGKEDELMRLSLSVIVPVMGIAVLSNDEGLLD
jgi:hypothetical protein